MADLDKGILMYDTSLRPEARARIRELGWADVLIGIPSHRNSRTIGEVVHAIAKGIADYLPNERVVLMNADGGSSDNTAKFVSEVSLPPNAERLITVYDGATGKGTAIRAILEAGALLNIRACMVVEARAPGIVPEWVPALVNPVLNGYDLACGCYQRSAYAAALTDNFVYPFVRAFFGADLREPLAGEFCVSGAVAANLPAQDVWETDVARFGVNIWLILQSLVDEQRVAQVDLGQRGDGSGEPGALGDARIAHTVGTLFRALSIHQRLWQENPARNIPFHSGRSPDCHIDCKACVGDLVQAFKASQAIYGEEWARILPKETFQRVLERAEQPETSFEFPLSLWVRCVLDMALVYNKGEGDPDKVAEAFLPLFYARSAAYLRETLGLSVCAREDVVEQIVGAFVAAKPSFRRVWNSYRAWVDPVGYDLP